MQPMQFVTPASAIEAVLKLRGCTVTPKRGSNELVIHLAGHKPISLNPSSRMASRGKMRWPQLKGETANEMADELIGYLRSE
jgi:hypothetical protein